MSDCEDFNNNDDDDDLIIPETRDSTMSRYEEEDEAKHE